MCSLKIAGSQSLSHFGSFDFQHDSNSGGEAQNKNLTTEIPNEVPSSGSSITMLSSTSLLHGNCIFNRNNTVATQAGLKTYWLCKSYRISMCKARCITHQVSLRSEPNERTLICFHHQGKVISATGIHNHLPHMSNKPQEIPAGHTPNVFNSSSHDFTQNSNSMPPSSSQHMQHQNAQPMMMQQPYHYLPQHMMMEHQPHVNITPVSLRQQPPANDAKMSFPIDAMSPGINQVPFKMEHI